MSVLVCELRVMAKTLHTREKYAVRKPNLVFLLSTIAA